MRYGNSTLSLREPPFLRFFPRASGPVKYKHHKESAHQGKYDKNCQACRELRYKK